MSILQDISKRLLDVSNVPPEKRNDALMQVLIYIETVQYDMVLEQKNLIMSVIEDLIAENDAEQIAKSKLVFVEDVEEQIAPTKKTRAKKVVTTVGEDLPDTIDNSLPVKDLPEQIKKLVKFRNEQEKNTLYDLSNSIMFAFDWEKTPEGYDFWSMINDKGDLREFKRIYGNKGEGVDAIIDELIGFNELLEMANKQNAQLINDAFEQAQAIKTRKPRTPKVAPVVAPVVAKQELIFLRLIFNPPVGSAITFEVYNPTELYTLVISIFNKLNVNELIFPFEAVSNLENNKTKVSLNINDSTSVMVAKLEEKFDSIVYPPIIWIDFKRMGYDKDRLALNEQILLDAFPKQKPVPVVAPVVTPKASTPKPVKVVAPKVVTPKVVTPKPVRIVAPKVVKTKVTKPKVEDDLSFLDDLNNIF